MKPRQRLVLTRARSFHKDLLCPPVPVHEIACSVARVVYVNEPTIKDAACFYLYSKKDPCIFINMYANPNRLRYSLAHETAHIVLNHFMLNDVGVVLINFKIETMKKTIETI